MINFQWISSSNDHLFLSVRDPGPPSSAAAEIKAAIIVGTVGGVLLVAFVIYCCHKRCTKTKPNGKYYILISIHVKIGFIIQKGSLKMCLFSLIDQTKMYLYCLNRHREAEQS